MRIALVQCPSRDVIFPPLCIASLSSYLKCQGHDVSLFDFNIELFDKVKPGSSDCPPELKGLFMGDLSKSNSIWENLDQCGNNPSISPELTETWADCLCEADAPVIGFSITYRSFPVSLLLAKTLKQRDPRTIVIFGGPSCFQSQILPPLLESGAVDAVIRAEGEIPLSMLLRTIERGNPVAPCAGVRVIQHGKIIDGGPGKTVRDLDQLPFPDYSGLPLAKYLTKGKEFPIVFGRGCIGRCTFCVERHFWHHYRSRSAENVVAEMKHHRQAHGARRFRFNDSLINGNLKELARMCDLLIKEEMGIKWHSYARIDGALTPGLLFRMREAGCERLDYGVESAAPAVLRSMCKGYTPQIVRKTLKNTLDAGIDAYTHWLVGFPTETRLDFLKTLAFIFMNRELIVVPPPWSSPCSISEGSDIHRDYLQYSLEWYVSNTGINWRTSDGRNSPEERKFRYAVFENFVKWAGVALDFRHDNNLGECSRSTMGTREFLSELWRDWRDYSSSVKTVER